MPNYKHGLRPTVGVLIGWQAYGGTLHGFLDPVLRGIQSAAQDRACNLLLACGLSYAAGPVYNACPAWPVASPETHFVPVGPWNTDGLIVITPLLSKTRSSYIQEVIASGHPVVFLGSGESGSVVDVDNEQGIRQAVAHLVGY